MAFYNTLWGPAGNSGLHLHVHRSYERICQSGRRGWHVFSLGQHLHHIPGSLLLCAGRLQHRCGGVPSGVSQSPHIPGLGITALSMIITYFKPIHRSHQLYMCRPITSTRSKGHSRAVSVLALHAEANTNEAQKSWEVSSDSIRCMLGVQLDMSAWGSNLCWNGRRVSRLAAAGVTTACMVAFMLVFWLTRRREEDLVSSVECFVDEMIDMD